MSLSGKHRQHPLRIRKIARFSKDPAFKFDHGIRSDNHGLRITGGDLLRLEEGIFQRKHHPRTFRLFFRIRNLNGKRKTETRQQLFSPRRCRGKNQIHYSIAFSMDLSLQNVIE